MSKKNSVSLDHPSFMDVHKSESSISEQFSNVAEPACIYNREDPRYRESAVRSNPLIDRELAKHKVIIEERYGKSLMNKNYKFLRQ